MFIRELCVIRAAWLGQEANDRRADAAMADTSNV